MRSTTSAPGFPFSTPPAALPPPPALPGAPPPPPPLTLGADRSPLASEGPEGDRGGAQSGPMEAGEGQGPGTWRAIGHHGGLQPEPPAPLCLALGEPTHPARGWDTGDCSCAPSRRGSGTTSRPPGTRSRPRPRTRSGSWRGAWRGEELIPGPAGPLSPGPDCSDSHGTLAKLAASFSMEVVSRRRPPGPRGPCTTPRAYGCPLWPTAPYPPVPSPHLPLSADQTPGAQGVDTAHSPLERLWGRAGSRSGGTGFPHATATPREHPT